MAVAGLACSLVPPVRWRGESSDGEATWGTGVLLARRQLTVLTLVWVPEPGPAPDHVRGRSVAEGLIQLRRTFREIRHLKTVMLFLFAYWFYIDGVDTIVRMAVDYGMSIRFESTDLITALLLVQFVGFPAAFYSDGSVSIGE